MKPRHEGNALLRRLVRIGVLDENRMKLDYVLGLRIEDFLERRLQTQVFKLGLAKSIHHARVLIRQRHIRVRKQLVNVPSFIVRLDSQKHIDFALNSPYGGGRPGRVKRKNLKKKQAYLQGMISPKRNCYTHYKSLGSSSGWRRILRMPPQASAYTLRA